MTQGEGLGDGRADVVPGHHYLADLQPVQQGDEVIGHDGGGVPLGRGHVGLVGVAEPAEVWRDHVGAVGEGDQDPAPVVPEPGPAV